MKVSNMLSSRGNKVANQFIITDGNKETFQSYDTVIAVIDRDANPTTTTLDENAWNYSVTTSKYRNKFLDCSTRECVKRIESGEYKLADLN